MAGNFVEVGITGLNRQGGYVYEEFIPHLRWPRAAKIYKEMASNDPTIGAILYMSEQLIRKATWSVVPASESKEDMIAKVFVEQCKDDMSTTWNDLIAEIISMMTYGWSWHEIVFKKRDGISNLRGANRHKSNYNDGRIGWHKIASRSQETLHQWLFDTDDSILGMIQQAPSDNQVRMIPLSKSLLFRTKVERDNPEGRSLLRNAYRPWYFKKHIEEIEGIGIERDLAGLPVMIPPDGLDIWNPDDEMAVRMKNEATKIVTNIRRDQNEGLVIPFGWELKLLSTGSRRQFDTNAILNRYDQRIAITMLADIVMLGADKVGSFALANVKKSLLAASLETILDSIASVFNRYAIPQLIDLNVFPGITGYPQLRHSEVETPDLNELANFIKALTGAQIQMSGDQDLEDYFRQVASMPRKNKAAIDTPPDTKPTEGVKPNEQTVSHRENE